MRIGETGTWLGVMTLSVILHAAVFLQVGSRMGADNIQPARERMVTHLSFHAVDTPKPQPPEVVEETPPPPPKPLPRKKKVVEPKPKKVAKSPPQPQPQVAPPVQPVAAPQPAGSDMQTEALLLEQKRNEYLRRLMGHIESHKFYPLAARRRGLQAMVRVSFELLADGEIRELQVTEGHKLLRIAAQQAVEKSLPLPIPPSVVETPLRVSFSMAYQLL